MNKSIIYICGVVLIGLILGFLMLKINLSSGNSSTIDSNQDAQKVMLSMKNYNYYPNTITVKANMPVSISLDSSVTGCFRAIVIKDFGVNEWLKTPKDQVTFTPTKKGTYRFACAMGMGTGTIIVE